MLTCSGEERRVYKCILSNSTELLLVDMWKGNHYLTDAVSASCLRLTLQGITLSVGSFTARAQLYTFLLIEVYENGL